MKLLSILTMILICGCATPPDRTAHLAPDSEVCFKAFSTMPETATTFYQINTGQRTHFLKSGDRFYGFTVGTHRILPTPDENRPRIGPVPQVLTLHREGTFFELRRNRIYRWDGEKFAEQGN